MSTAALKTVTAIALLVTSGVAFANTIRCTSGSKSITISLNERRAFGAELSCIRAAFISDMTPCAPNGGFGLSAPTGTAPLVGVVYRWQDYMDHSGAITRFRMTGDQMVFSGHFIFSGDLKDLWSFNVDRISGVGKLTVQDKDVRALASNATYRCERVTAKF